MITVIGACKFGDQCTYAHGNDELRKVGGGWLVGWRVEQSRGGNAVKRKLDFLGEAGWLRESFWVGTWGNVEG